MSAIGAVKLAGLTHRRRLQLSALWSYPRLGIGSVLLMSLVLLSALAPLVAPYSPTTPVPSNTLQAPSGAHWLGTDSLGRDVLSRCLYGGGQTLEIAVLAGVLATALGVVLGLLAGQIRGVVDTVIMRAMEAIMAFPALILALTIAFALGASFGSILIAVTVVSIPHAARLVRSEVLTLTNRRFVESAKVSGASRFRIMGVHLLPNVTEIITVQVALACGQAIFTSASLSFLGLGLPPPSPSWGSSLKDGYVYLSVLPLQSIVPGALVFVALLSFNLIGDGLRDLFDPRTLSKQRIRL
jgi:peptide/nickel transport system permease protein